MAQTVWKLHRFVLIRRPYPAVPSAEADLPAVDPLPTANEVHKQPPEIVQEFDRDDEEDQNNAELTFDRNTFKIDAGFVVSTCLVRSI
jgi:hypothetical protein